MFFLLSVSVSEFSTAFRTLLVVIVVLLVLIVLFFVIVIYVFEDIKTVPVILQLCFRDFTVVVLVQNFVWFFETKLVFPNKTHHFFLLVNGILVLCLFLTSVFDLDNITILYLVFFVLLLLNILILLSNNIFFHCFLIDDFENLTEVMIMRFYL